MEKTKRHMQIVLNQFKDTDEETLNLTLKELINKYQLKIDTYIKKQKDIDNKIINKYKNTYLKRIDPEKMFGESLEVIHIKNIKVDGVDDMYNKLYMLQGTEITFSKLHTHIKDFDNTPYSSRTESELAEYTEISKNEYDAYVEEYNKINKSLKRFLRDGVVLDNDSDKLNWPEVLTWKTEYSIEEQKKKLTQLIYFVKRQEHYHPYLKENRIIWEKQLKELKNNE